MSTPDQSDPYIVLALKRTATAAQIGAAFRKQAKATHPDKHADKSEIERNAFEAQFRRAKWAFDVLSDAEHRAYFDKHGRTRESAAAATPSPVDQTLQETFRTVLMSIHSMRTSQVDLIKEIRLKITDDRISIRSEISKLEQVRKELKKLEGRFLRDDDPQNTIAQVIASDLAQLNAVIEGKQSEADHLKLCLDELQRWRFVPSGTEYDAALARVNSFLRTAPSYAHS